MSAPGKVGNPTGKGGGLRGKVKTFSIASRRRFRMYLLQHGFPGGWFQYAVSFTLPGPVRTSEEYRALWHQMSLSVEDNGWGMVWRAEVQKREALHWHCLIGIPPVDQYGRTLEEWIKLRDDVGGRAGVVVGQTQWIKDTWRTCYDRVFGEVRFELDKRGKHPYCPQIGQRCVSGPLSWWRGAWKHDCVVDHQLEEAQGWGRAGWYRYLADHASKVKAEQVGEDIGRHWGVVGRKRFVRSSSEFTELDAKRYAAFRRAYERLATPHRPDEASPFGNRLGYRCKRGRRGRAVCFVKPETVERLLTYAKGVGQ